MELPKELSIAEIRNYMLANECKVTNHALVKHFKKFLTHPQSQNEARKRFKTYVTLLSTIKNENNQKFLILRKKYVNECPTDEVVERAVAAASGIPEPSSPGGASLNFDSPMRQPPPYKPPPMVTSPPAVSIAKEHQENYQECVDEFTAAIKRIEPARLERRPSVKSEDLDQQEKPEKTSRSNSIDVIDNKENIPRFSFSSEASSASSTSIEKPEMSDPTAPAAEGDVAENPISVKEATRKFNRMASEEEAKIISPPAKKKPEKQLIEEKDSPEVTLAHPKAKEWIVSMAKANYQELAKMASEYPELVKLQCPATTALHWAAKHGNEDVVKLIAGTYKADVNARTNGGYTPLHLATQFGRDNIFELLWNVYKANRDIMDWSGNKPLDYSRQRSSVSASTCSKIQAMRFSGGLNGTWRNQGSQKACNRKRFGLPTDWFSECPGKEDHRGVQQLLGSGQWADGLWQWRVGGSSKSPSPSISPSPSSASSSPRWYDTESPSESEGSDEHTLCHERRPSVEGECAQ
ncbi:ankyrin repeat domain-containing protein SOWAHC isoform X2 [Drosophila simulans]|uniref:ankyrin repeat domain-containing protein SOWAHC isoform X2 n=1 Tax=Drosophila simulans TaxID=7240 RepID=UPI00192CE761|nr:ankyrin repeat domain-containing protein SOWAHC isoform X2 [Drosophila simulans]